MQQPPSQHSYAPAAEAKPVEPLELEHSIGYNGKYQDTVDFHPTQKDSLIYNIGGLLVIENVQDKHQQQFLRGHDMEISTIAVSNSGKLMATG